MRERTVLPKNEENLKKFEFFYFSWPAKVAQMVEHSPSVQKFVGLNPPTAWH
jgi:hypothetical protein